MRTRKKKYSDYGITKREKEYIMQYCRQADSEQKEIIKAALSDMDPYIGQLVLNSLLHGLSYEEMFCRDYIYIGKGDFYGYRRKGIAAIKRWMILYEIWEIE